MQLTQVEARDFRCLRQVAFNPAPGINLLRGDNAQGKTSVLEAILYAATSKSHRTNSDDDLVCHGTPGFRVGLTADRSDRTVAVEAIYWEKAKRFKINGVAQPRLSDILGRIHIVMFSPDDVELVRGGAAGRRRFLDMELSQINAPYLGALQQYRQTLRQRNELLRAYKVDPDLFDVWDEQLARQGAQLIAARTAYVEQLAPLTAAVHARIADGEAMALTYAPDVRNEQEFREVLTRNRAGDQKRGQTSRGPHRDDLGLLVAGQSARAFASQGQQKTAALALKLAELELIHARVGEYPALLLDEVLAELDEHRAAQLFDTIPDAVQCFVTTTEVRLDTRRFSRDATSFRIEAGTLHPET